MKETSKTKAQLTLELESLRQRIAQLEESEAGRKVSVDAQRDRAQKYLDIAEVMLVAIDAEQKITMMNRKGCELLGYEQSEVVGKNWFDSFLPERVRSEVKAVFKKIVVGEIGLAKYQVNPVVTSSGEERLVAWHNTMITDEQGKIMDTLSSGEDVTDRERWEEEMKLRTQLLDNATDAILLLDFEGSIVYANQTACKSFAYSREELVGMNISKLDPPGYTELRRQHLKKMREKVQTVFEFAHLCKDGSIQPVETHISIIESGGKKFFLGVLRDISERRKMQASLVIADRLASLGELASGFAHELNNPLTGVIGYSQLLMEDKSLPENARQDVERIYGEARRVDNVIKNFLVFARKQPPTKQPADVNDIISRVLKLREYEQKIKNINVIANLSPDLPIIMADISQLQQCFLNIVINAEHSMLKAHNKGTLTVTTEIARDVVKASFADDGAGISQENLAHIFDPFFTTKGVGQGTGMGLSICHGIISEHGGRVYAESEPGKGATFVVELPAENSKS